MTQSPPPTGFGRHYPTPIIAAPVGVLELVHRQADLGIARAAASVGELAPDCLEAAR